MLRELLQEISTTDKTVLQRSNCITLKEQQTQLKEIIKEITNNKISKEIKLFFLPCPKSRFLEWTYTGFGVSLVSSRYVRSRG